MEELSYTEKMKLSATAIAACKGRQIKRVKKQKVDKETFKNIQNGGVFNETSSGSSQICSNPQVSK